jgi:hypothetical protein
MGGHHNQIDIPFFRKFNDFGNWNSFEAMMLVGYSSHRRLDGAQARPSQH